MSNTTLELRIEKHGDLYKAFDMVTGVENKEPRQCMMMLAYENDEILYLAGSKWRRRSATGATIKANRTAAKKSKGKVAEVKDEIGVIDPNAEADETVKFIHASVNYKPADIIISDLKWKFLIRSIIRGKNIMVTGPTRSGKTQTVIAAAAAMNRPFFRFNLGQSQDPKSFLIGNTHYEKEKGTVFVDSAFIKAIETENAVILLDEFSRAHPEAWNILMTVLDPGQRYLRIDDDPNTPTISVAEGVSFLATANIGNEYTSTRIMDKAIKERFCELEMEYLDLEGERKLLGLKFPTLPAPCIDAVASIAIASRDEMKTSNPKLSFPISTGTSIELAELLNDRFRLEEAAQVTVYPRYSADGGAESERTFIKQLVQKYVDDGSSDILVNAVSDDTTQGSDDSNIGF